MDNKNAPLIRKIRDIQAEAQKVIDSVTSQFNSDEAKIAAQKFTEGNHWLSELAMKLINK